MRLRLMPVLLMLTASPVFAQDAPDNVWVNIDFASAQPTQEAQTYTFSAPLFGETASLASAYPDLPSAKGGDIGGGFRVFRNLGFGIHFVAVDYEMNAGLAISIPHPAFFNRSATDADVTASPLERSDRSVDLSAVYTLPTPDALRVRVFGGPTYFKIRQDMVSDIRFTQVFNLLGGNVVDITGFDQREVDASAWGFNVGVDVAYFFSRYIGVGGNVRFNKGTVDIDEEPLSEEPAEFDAGGAVFGGGLRLRF
jgi:hypothetical protein